jgi:hypothetical protein
VDIDLIAETIARVRDEGWITSDAPDIDEPVPLPPDVIDALRLPGDRPLPPSVRKWLAYDASWFAAIGWYDDPRAPSFEGMSLSAATTYMYGEDVWEDHFRAFETLLPGPCLPLVGGSDSRRLLYLGEPDATGEYPVLVTDVDDVPYVAVMYPGLDVYLAELAGVVELDFGTYTGLIDEPAYADRMREHAALTGLGEDGLEIQDLWTSDGLDDADEDDEDDD